MLPVLASFDSLNFLGGPLVFHILLQITAMSGRLNAFHGDSKLQASSSIPGLLVRGAHMGIPAYMVGYAAS